MWSPTHVQVTVQRAKGLLIKGKNGTNDCFVTIALGKEKYQTSVKYKVTDTVEWCEECDLQIPDQGNTAEVVLKVLNQNFMGDNVLGQVSIPLSGLDVYERPKYRWYALKGKPGKENSKNRGELEIKVSFNVKEGSLTDLSKKEKHKTSFSSLAQNVGGSLLSIGSLEKKKGIKKFAKNLGSKLNINKKDKKSDSSSTSGSVSNVNLKSIDNSPIVNESRQIAGEADPGVISEDEDEFAFDDLSHKSSGSSLNIHSSTLPRRNKYTPSPLNASLENLGGGELLRRSVSSGLSGSEKTPPAKPQRFGLEGTNNPQIPSHTIGQTDEWSRKLYSRPKSQSQIIVDKEKSASLEKNKSLDSPSSLRDKTSPNFFKKFSKEKPKRILDERIIVGEEGIAEEESINMVYNNLPKEALKLFDNKTREDLVVTAWALHKDIESEKKKVKDLENYLDELLLRVMETTPRILQNPYSMKNNIHFRNK